MGSTSDDKEKRPFIGRLQTHTEQVPSLRLLCIYICSRISLTWSATIQRLPAMGQLAYGDEPSSDRLSLLSSYDRRKNPEKDASHDAACICDRIWASPKHLLHTMVVWWSQLLERQAQASGIIATVDWSQKFCHMQWIFAMSTGKLSLKLRTVRWILL